MDTRTLTIAAALTFLLAPGSAVAQDGGFVTEVQSGDPDVNRATRPVDIRVVFVDADGDGRLDAANPDETVYLAPARTQRVSFGDLRLTPFLTYPTGTAVNYTNRDVDLVVDEIPGWFAQDNRDNWYVDARGDGTLEAGDLALTLGGGVEKIQPDDPRVGRSVQGVQSGFPQAERFTFVDEGPQGLDWSDRLYLDLDGDKQANRGELRFDAIRLGIDDNPTGREFKQAIQELRTRDDQLREELVQNDKQTQSRVDALEADLAQARADLSTKDNWILALGIVDLVGVAGVGYWVYRNRSET